jgi:hypothetical protein
MLVVAIAGLQACGGGSGDGGLAGLPPNEGPSGNVGVFKDSNVSGLSYTSGTLSGVTRQDGTFDYQANQQTTFRIGGVTLGSTAGKPVVTPIDLVPSGSSTTTSVINIARLLMTLDADTDPDNGIVISQNVQTRAANWSSVNFADAGFDTTLATLAADARSADGGLHTIPTSLAARLHVESTFLCAASGAYRGTFTGGEQGRFAVIVTPNAGQVIGLGAVANQFGNFAITATTFLSIDQQMTFVSRNDQTGATFSGRLQSPDVMTGTWSQTGTSGGTFTGTRLLAKRDAIYRYSGFFSDPALPESGIVTFDVNSAGQLTGIAYGTLRDQLTNFTGTLTASTLSATASNGASITATVPTALPLNLQGTWTSTGAAGTFSALGCKLN